MIWYRSIWTANMKSPARSSLLDSSIIDCTAFAELKATVGWAAKAMALDVYELTAAVKFVSDFISDQ